MKKIILSIIVLVVLVSWAAFYYYTGKWSVDTVQANPDYICKKAVNDSPCEITRCDEWSTEWTRTCHWEKTTEVAYYLIRTSCEAWYTKESKWWSVWGNSWRQGWNYVNATTSCTTVEVDNVAPIGTISE